MMTHRHRSRRGMTRRFRLLRGLRHMHKYAVGSALAAIIGCVPPNNAMKISPDGRFLVVPYTEAGVGIGEKPARVVVIDLENNSASLARADLQGTFLWFDRAGDTTVFMEGLENSKVVILHGLDQMKLDGAMFPSLSSDGRWLAAMQGEEGLIVHDVVQKQTTRIVMSGELPDLSPNGERILYLKNALNHKGFDDPIDLHIIDRDGSNDRLLTTIHVSSESLFDPQWIDDERIMFVGRTAETGEDEEVFVVDLEGKVTVITNNDLDDRYPQFIGDNKYLYSMQPAKGADKVSMGHIHMAERTDDGWQFKNLGIESNYFTARGDRLIYLAAEGDKVVLRMKSLDDLDAPATDLDALIHEQLPEFRQ